MKVCKNCNYTTIDNTDNFCPKCGGKLEITPKPTTTRNYVLGDILYTKSNGKKLAVSGKYSYNTISNTIDFYSIEKTNIKLSNIIDKLGEFGLCLESIDTSIYNWQFDLTFSEDDEKITDKGGVSVININNISLREILNDEVLESISKIHLIKPCKYMVKDLLSFVKDLIDGYNALSEKSKSILENLK